MKIAASALAREHSGIGTLQRMVYPELRAVGHELIFTEVRDLGATPRARARGLISGLSTPPFADAFLSMTSPLPFRLPNPTIAYVYDVRWRRTRGWAARAYRWIDFRRTVRRAERIIAISEHAASEIIDFAPSAADKIKVIHPGPGQLANISFGEKRPGKLVLIGAASHKRNELGVQTLVRAHPDWLSSVVGINISQDVMGLLKGSRLADSSRFERNLSAEHLISELSSAEYFMHLGTEEGFGLPYVEALGLGCQVIAIDQPLTQELLGQAGILLKNGNVDALAEQLQVIQPIASAIRHAVASNFSWSQCGQALAAELRAVGA